MTETNVELRNNISVHGKGDRVLLLAHGFGCDQRMWRFVLPTLSEQYTVVLFDYVGSGNSDLSSFSTEKYATLEGYASGAEYLAPLVMGANASEELTGELSGSFCSTDPVIAKTFAKATFFSDHRSLLPLCQTNTLILQSESDALASVGVGQYVHKNMPNSELQVVDAQGHCLHMTDPQKTSQLMVDFLVN